MEKSFKLESSMLTGSLWKPVLLFALPLAATGILQQLFNAADIAVVGQFTQERGAIAMAAVGANAPVVALLLNFFVGISLGSNVVIANALGSGNHTIVRSAIGTSVLLALLGGVLMGVVGEMIVAVVRVAQRARGSHGNGGFVFSHLHARHAGYPAL